MQGAPALVLAHNARTRVLLSKLAPRVCSSAPRSEFALQRQPSVRQAALEQLPTPMPFTTGSFRACASGSRTANNGVHQLSLRADCGQLPFASNMWPKRHTQGLSSRQYGTHNCRRRCRSVETRLRAYMIRSLCTFLVLSCVAGLSDVLTGHLWKRYAEANGWLLLGAIYQRIQAV